MIFSLLEPFSPMAAERAVETERSTDRREMNMGLQVILVSSNFEHLLSIYIFCSFPYAQTAILLYASIAHFLIAALANIQPALPRIRELRLSGESSNDRSLKCHDGKY